MTKHDIILEHIKSNYSGQQFTAIDVARDLGYDPSNVSAYLCKMRDNMYIKQVSVDNALRNVYSPPVVAPMVDNSINKSKIKDMIKSLVPSKSLADYSDEELVAELKRRL
jgi:predicted transcriptional regulator with HTH domain